MNLCYHHLNLFGSFRYQWRTDILLFDLFDSTPLHTLQKRWLAINQGKTMSLHTLERYIPRLEFPLWCLHSSALQLHRYSILQKVGILVRTTTLQYEHRHGLRHQLWLQPLFQHLTVGYSYKWNSSALSGQGLSQSMTCAPSDLQWFPLLYSVLLRYEVWVRWILLVINIVK